VSAASQDPADGEDGSIDPPPAALQELGALREECQRLQALTDRQAQSLRTQRGGLQRLERKLESSRIALQAFMDAIPESALLLDPDGIVLAANRTVARRLGRDPAGMIGRSIYEITPAGCVSSAGRASKRSDARASRCDSRISV
jgi:PAS domain-containing protein